MYADFMRSCLLDNITFFYEICVSDCHNNSSVALTINLLQWLEEMKAVSAFRDNDGNLHGSFINTWGRSSYVLTVNPSMKCCPIRPFSNSKDTLSRILCKSTFTLSWSHPLLSFPRRNPFLCLQGITRLPIVFQSCLLVLALRKRWLSADSVSCCSLTKTSFVAAAAIWNARLAALGTRWLVMPHSTAVTNTTAAILLRV